MQILTLDIGGTALKAAQFNFNAVPSGYKETPSRGKEGVTALIQAVTTTLKAYSGYQVIGVSTAGQVDTATGTIAAANDNIPGYAGMQLKDFLQSTFHVPVVIENDGKCAALGEYSYGAGRSLSSFVCLTYGTGIGSGIIENGHIYKGIINVASELGHLCLHPGGLSCACGLRGCYEAYASTSRLIAIANKACDDIVDGHTFFAAFPANPMLQEILLHWAEEVVQGLATIVKYYPTSHFVLGGGILSQPSLLPLFANILATWFPSANISLLRAQLGNRAGLYGAMTLARQLLEKGENTK